MRQRYKYFTQNDFDNCVPKCKLEDMDVHTMEQFDQARAFAGVPFVVNSAFRTRQHEISKGRDGTSSHITGKAMDIRVTDSRHRYMVINGLLQAGFTRLGVARTFVHADLDDKDNQLIWTYL